MKRVFVILMAAALMLFLASPAKANPGAGTKGSPCADALNIKCNAGLACVNGFCSEVKVPAGGGASGPSPDTAGAVKLGCPNGHISSAIGCIPLGNTNTMAAFFLRWGVGIAGGVALFTMGLASYRIMTSQGDPRRLQGGQELLLSAFGGLLMLILSVYLLRFIGVDVLGIF